MTDEMTAEKLYRRRISERQCFLDEAYRSSKLTLPSLIPDNQDIINRSPGVTLAKPFQSLGARGVNNLASKLLLTLLPPTAPFMKYELAGEAKVEAEESSEDLAGLKSKLAVREMLIQSEVDLQGIRSKGFQVLKHELVAGNVMTYSDPDEGGLQVFPLNSYTAKRDGRGQLLDLIYVEKLDRMGIFDERILDILRDSVEETKTEADEADKPVLLFTRVMRTGKDSFESYQEVNGMEVEGSRDTHKQRTLPWLVLRLNGIDGEDYGHGFVEEYRGDLTTYEQMSRDMRFASANAAKVVWRVSPNSPVDFEAFANLDNGAGFSAEDGDVAAIRLDKGGDMNVVNVQISELKQSLSADFLLNSSFQREQERVTAEEIRRMAEELEDTLGGLFSLMSQEFQLPLALLLEEFLIKHDSTFKRLPEGTVKVGVVTGLAAIGRGQELNRLLVGVKTVAEADAAIPGVARFIKPENLSTRIWTGSGVDTEGLLYTAEEVAEQDQAAQQANAQKTLGEDMSKGAGTAIGKLPPEQVQETLAQSQGIPQQ
jgi:hypothetical protein